MSDVMTDDKNIYPLPDAARIEREAAEWFTRLDNEEAGEAVRAAFREWCAQSDQHRLAAERMASFWDGLGALEALRDHALADEVSAAVEEDSRPPAFSAKVAIAAAMAASLVAIAGFLLTETPPVSYEGALATARGEQRAVDLPDGSQAVLNTDSAAAFAFDGRARRVTLDKGEAFFDVAHDKKRPFVVATPNGDVTAVGTAFSVRVFGDRTSVVVAEGRVALSSAGAAAPPVEVAAGEEAALGDRAPGGIDASVLEKKLDWRDGVLAFRGETLENVIAELGRYTDTTIEITDADLRQQKIVAYYRVGEIDTMLDALDMMAEIDVERLGDNHVRLNRGAAKN